MSRTISQTRSLQSELKTRAEPDNENMVIEGYFVVFGKEAELWTGAYEEISPTAFNNCLGNDVRALVNHDSRLVIGRNKSGTLDLRVDSHGLWGSVKINAKDIDAVNLYERVKRGDVDQCSFGFNITKETTDWREDGSVKWTIEEVDLYEVSVCTFPAYEETGVQARSNQIEQHKVKKLEVRKSKLKERLQHGTKAIND